MSDQNATHGKDEEAKGLNKVLYRIMSWLGFTSGVGLIAWGTWWFLWSVGQFILVQPENAIQQQVTENYFNQAQLSAILAALGVLIMEVKKIQPGGRS